MSDGTTLVVFVDNGRFEPDISDATIDTAEADDRVHQLEEETNLLRRRLRLATEELETANEELKSSNEEMMSMNEELQSTNEELTTVNDELKSKIEVLGELNDDLSNFLDSTDLAVVIVDEALRVRTFTPKARSIFPLEQADRGRRLTEVAATVSGLYLSTDVRKAMTEGPEVERLVTASDRLAVEPQQVVLG